MSVKFIWLKQWIALILIWESNRVALLIRKNIFNRLVTNDQIINSARIIKSARINLSTLNIINSPTEIPMDMIQTLKLNRLIHPEGMHISTLYPYSQYKN